MTGLEATKCNVEKSTLALILQRSITQYKPARSRKNTCSHNTNSRGWCGRERADDNCRNDLNLHNCTGNALSRVSPPLFRTHQALVEGSRWRKQSLLLMYIFSTRKKAQPFLLRSFYLGPLAFLQLARVIQKVPSSSRLYLSSGPEAAYQTLHVRIKIDMQGLWWMVSRSAGSCAECLWGNSQYLKVCQFKMLND